MARNAIKSDFRSSKMGRGGGSASQSPASKLFGDIHSICPWVNTPILVYDKLGQASTGDYELKLMMKHAPEWVEPTTTTQYSEVQRAICTVSHRYTADMGQAYQKNIKKTLTKLARHTKQKSARHTKIGAIYKKIGTCTSF